MKMAGLFRKSATSVLLLSLLLLSGISTRPAHAAAGINQQMNFQGRLLNNQGATVPDGYYNIQFKIYQDGDGQSAGDTTGSPVGSLKWTESYLNNNSQGVEVRNGFLSVQLGSITPFGTSIDWGQDTLWLSMNIGGTSPTCGTFASCSPDGEMVPMKRLSATPYALNSGLLGGLSSADFLQFAQGSFQADNSSNTSIALNKIGSGNIIELQSNGTDTFTINNSGDVMFGNNANHTLSVATASSGAGKSLTVAAGNAAIGSNMAGGDLVLQGGNGDGSGASGKIILAQNTTLAAGKSLTVSGGNTASRPSSPTAGMVYYDTTTNQLLTYTGGKWQADKSTATEIVAAGGSSQTNKDKADFVGDGTNDQNAINSAIAALPATGGSVVLLDGTYNLTAAINMPTNTNMTGQGSSTILKRQYNEPASLTSGLINLKADNIALSNFKIDGNKSTYSNSYNVGILTSSKLNNLQLQSLVVTNNAGYGYYVGWNIFSLAGNGNGGVVAQSQFSNNGIDGIYARNAFMTIRDNSLTYNTSMGIDMGFMVGGLKISGNYIAYNQYGIGAQGGGTANTTISDNTIVNNTSSGINACANDSVISTNVISGNGDAGVRCTGSGVVISNNTVVSNTNMGIYSTQSGYGSGNTISSNRVRNNGSTGIVVNNDGGDLISNNSLDSNGNTGGFNASGIALTYASTGNRVINNTITQSSGTTYAIVVGVGSTDSNDYLSNNTFSGSGAAGILDNGIGTIFANQQDVNGNIVTRGQAGIGLNGTTSNYSLQNAGSFVQGGLVTPSIPAVAVNGTAGTTTWGYKVTAFDGLGETLASTEKQITTGNATLNVTNFNQIVPSRVNGAVSYKVYRTTAGGSPNTVGLIGTIPAGSSTFYLSDTGLSASGSAPVANTTGNITLTGNLGVGTVTPQYKLDVVGGSGIVGQFSGRVIGADAVNNNEFVTKGQANTAYQAAGSAVNLQNITPGTVQTGNFNISGTGIAGILQGNTSILTPTVDTATATSLSIGVANATNIQIGNSLLGSGTQNITIGNNSGGGTTNVTIGSNSGASGGNTTLQAKQNITLATNGITRATLDNANSLYLGNGITAGAPNDFTVSGTGSSTTGVTGGAVTIQGGNATVGNANGGSLLLKGGAGSGTGASGLVVIATPTFSTTTNDPNCYTSGALVAASCTIANASLNNSAAILVGFSNGLQTANLPNPTNTTAGRVVYITAANGSSDFTLSVNGGGTGNTIAMRQNTSATMIWNGTAWTAAGASSSTTLQSAYDNTLQSAGGAELIVSHTSNTNGLTIRDSSTNPVNGTLLSVQTASAAALFSVNSNVTEYSSNGGAEVAGGSTSTFPAATWAANGSSTVSRYTTAGNYIATGQGAVSVVTASSAGAGVKDTLSTSLTANTNYNVSFSTRLASGTFTDMDVYYSANGTATSVPCKTSQAVATSIWTKVNCTFAAPASGITSSNAILIRQTGAAAHTFYVDNLSVTIAADYNYANDGSVSDAVNFATNWTSVSGAGVSRTTSVGNDASDSAQVITTGTGQGIRNKLAINPLTSTLYRVSVYVASNTSGFNSFTVRYSRDGGSNFVNCADYNTQSVSASTSNFTQVTCYITTDGTAATNPYLYFTQTDATGRTFYVDTLSATLSSNTTPNVQIGGGVTGGPVTLLTLDKGASAPIASNNDALLGSMYYDTTLGKLQCYEADGWGACGSSPDNIVTISPEYTNAVLHGTGVGTMTSDLCSDALNINDGSSGQDTICGSNETYNFYKWTSPQATNQAYSIYVTYQLPGSFKGFASGQTSIMGRTDSANSSVNYQVYRNDSATGLSPCGSAVAVSSGAVGSWQTGIASGAADPSTCGFAPGNSIVFKITANAKSNADAYISNLNFIFSNR